MTGQEIIEKYLTREEQRLFVINIRACNWNYSSTLHEESTIPLIFGGSFCWGDTPEGSDYWDEIGVRVENGILPGYSLKTHKFV